MVLLTMIVIMMISVFLVPFKININTHAVLAILAAYEIVNVIKILSILIFHRIKKTEKAAIVTLWLRLSIIALIIPVIVVLIYLWDSSANTGNVLP